MERTLLDSIRVVTSRQLNQLSFRCRVALVVVSIVLVPIELVAHGILAKNDYDLNVEILRVSAVAAVTVGAQYLPTDPNAAVREADAYAKSHGIARHEIIFTALSSNDTVLTIRLDRKLPRYIAVLALGGLPAREIEVTASARPQLKTPIRHSIMFFNRHIALLRQPGHRLSPFLPFPASRTASFRSLSFSKSGPGSPWRPLGRRA
jgi:hypothetical protein